MKLPKSFEVMGQKISVKYVKDLAQHGAVGLYNHFEKTIYIQTHLDGKALSKDVQMSTYYHELMHCVFSYLNYNEDNSNEQKVDIIGALLHQIHKTVSS